MSSPAPAGTKAFTLVEIMIVVVIIGLLAALAIPGFQKVKRSAVSKRYINDARVIRDAAQQYAMEKGIYPPNGVASLHPDLAGYVPAKVMTATTTPIGGVWDWDYQQAGFTALVSVWQYNVDDAQLSDIDRTIDDGNLNAGMFRKDGAKAIWIIEP